MTRALRGCWIANEGTPPSEVLGLTREGKITKERAEIPSEGEGTGRGHRERAQSEGKGRGKREKAKRGQREAREGVTEGQSNVPAEGLGERRLKLLHRHSAGVPLVRPNAVELDRAVHRLQSLKGMGERKPRERKRERERGRARERGGGRGMGRSWHRWCHGEVKIERHTRAHSRKCAG